MRPNLCTELPSFLLNNARSRPTGPKRSPTGRSSFCRADSRCQDLSLKCFKAHIRKLVMTIRTLKLIEGVEQLDALRGCN